VADGFDERLAHLISCPDCFLSLARCQNIFSNKFFLALPLRKKPGVERKLNEPAEGENAHKFCFAFAIGNTNGKWLEEQRKVLSVAKYLAFSLCLLN